MVIKTLKGEKIGSYFGAALLAADVTADAVDDLFIGAPTYSSNHYDEGCVYFYKNKRDVILMQPFRPISPFKGVF